MRFFLLRSCCIQEVGVQVKTKEGPDLFGLLRINDDPTALRIDVVSQDRMAAGADREVTAARIMRAGQLRGQSQRTRQIQPIEALEFASTRKYRI